MGLFDRNKMSKDAGEWASFAMGCMVYADGSAGEAEVAAARGQVATNPVLKNSIGTDRAEKLFNETIEAVAQIPEAMLPSYEGKLAELAGKIDELDEKNFALATVIAVAMGDRSLSEGEHAMLVRFRDMLGATIPLPQQGKPTPAPYRQAAQVAPTAPASQAGAASSGGEAAASGAKTCPTCGGQVPAYEGYGHWCATCQAYLSDEAPAAGGKGESQAVASSAGVNCPTCGKGTQHYPGYGDWCAACQRYASA